MTVKRLTKRRTKLEKRQAEVISDLISGLAPAEVAKKYAVARSSVGDFIDRHRETVTALQLTYDEQVRNFAIASKVFRVRELDSLYNESRDWLREQGYSERVTRYNRDGEVVSQTDRYRDATIAQIRGLLGDAAAEMGERTTKGDTTNIAAVVNIIRGGTPLGMQPLDVSRETPVSEQIIEAAYTIDETNAGPGESLEATDQ